jgi:hypothetical protein
MAVLFSTLTFFLCICSFTHHSDHGSAGAPVLQPPLPLLRPPHVAMAQVFLHSAAAGLGAPASVPPPPPAHVPSGPAVASIIASSGRPSMMHSPMGDVELINPHFIKSVWTDTKLRMCCGLLLLLPSAVTSLGMLKSKVLLDGQTYRLDILIPDAITNPEKFLLFIRAYPGALA